MIISYFSVGFLHRLSHLLRPLAHVPDLLQQLEVFGRRVRIAGKRNKLRYTIRIPVGEKIQKIQYRNELNLFFKVF